MSADEVHADLALLSDVLRVENVRVVGGEPLLHSGLDRFLQAIKDSGISGKVTLVTNGLLLDRVYADLWTLVDKVEVSLYPLAPRITERIRAASDRVAACGPRVDVLEYSTFREAMTSEPAGDFALVKQTYDSCQIAHFWRCITVDHGSVYRCPQSMFKARVVGAPFVSDSRRIDELRDVDAVLAFLENEEPLAACSSCLGSVGATFPHQQTSCRAWLNEIARRPEDVVDRAYLAELTEFPRTRTDAWSAIPQGGRRVVRGRRARSTYYLRSGDCGFLGQSIGRDAPVMPRRSVSVHNCETDPYVGDGWTLVSIGWAPIEVCPHTRSRSFCTQETTTTPMGVSEISR